MRPREALIVDDDPEGREALAEVLAEDGYVVRQAENGRVAVRMIAERPPSVLILDLEMPVMSGWELLAWMRRDPALAGLKVVVISGATSPPAHVTFLRKGCRIDHLVEVIHACALHIEPGPGEAWQAGSVSERGTREVRPAGREQ